MSGPTTACGPKRYKLISYPGFGRRVAGSSDREFEPEWELFDLAADPMELVNVYDDPNFAHIREDLEAELDRLQRAAGDTP